MRCAVEVGGRQQHRRNAEAAHRRPPRDRHRNAPNSSGMARSCNVRQVRSGGEQRRKRASCQSRAQPGSAAPTANSPTTPARRCRRRSADKASRRSRAPTAAKPKSPRAAASAARTQTTAAAITIAASSGGRAVTGDQPRRRQAAMPALQAAPAPRASPIAGRAGSCRGSHVPRRQALDQSTMATSTVAMTAATNSAAQICTVCP